MTFFENQANLKVILVLILVLLGSILVCYGSNSRSRTKSPLPRTLFPGDLTCFPWDSVIIALLPTLLFISLGATGFLIYMAIRLEEALLTWVKPLDWRTKSSHDRILTISYDVQELKSIMTEELSSMNYKISSMNYKTVYDVVVWVTITVLVLGVYLLFRKVYSNNTD